ncbi:MAG: BON domain-containing protein, partial [Endomicrobiales bacterium]
MSVKSMLVSELDYRIISSTKSSYIFKTYFDDANITILSEDGVVTLEGHVKNEFQKMLADGVLSH